MTRDYFYRLHLPHRPVNDLSTAVKLTNRLLSFWADGGFVYYKKSPQSVFSRQVLIPYKRPLASGKPQTANRSLQLRVCCFALPRFQTLARRSVQFSSFLFSQNITQYKNTYRNCKVARELRRNQKAYETWTPQSQRNKQNKMKFAE